MKTRFLWFVMIVILTASINQSCDNQQWSNANSNTSTYDPCDDYESIVREEGNGFTAFVGYNMKYIEEDEYGTPISRSSSRELYFKLGSDNRLLVYNLKTKKVIATHDFGSKESYETREYWCQNRRITLTGQTNTYKILSHSSNEILSGSFEDLAEAMGSHMASSMLNSNTGAKAAYGTFRYYPKGKGRGGYYTGDAAITFESPL